MSKFRYELYDGKSKLFESDNYRFMADVALDTQMEFLRYKLADNFKVKDNLNNKTYTINQFVREGNKNEI